jgi:hypothetical protein
VTASTAGGGALAVTDTASSLNFGTNGVTATASDLTLRGGTSSTTMVLNDDGVTFTDTTTGGAATVTGVAAGRTRFDAVNFGQLSDLEEDMSAGIAGVAAMANIPAPTAGKKFAVGGGFGHFNGESAAAIGGTALVTDSFVIKGSVGVSADNTVFGAGAAYSW